ncbi:nuclear transport factor 2 family protein [Mesorhizobium sp. M0938]|uniref:nuclear transport factor 2 family protein n=1 Tax=unclassified Mesorhizobium TaxID=325217 RepID=UPI00333AE75D
MTILAPDGRIDCDAATLGMLERQADAWKSGDFSAAAADWHPDGVLTAPGNRVPLHALARTIADFHRDYGDLSVTVTSAFASADGRRVALEWLWEVTRRRDGARSLTEDAILIDLDGGRRILSWREYFDTASAVEDHHSPQRTA